MLSQGIPVLSLHEHQFGLSLSLRDCHVRSHDSAPRRLDSPFLRELQKEKELVRFIVPLATTWDINLSVTKRQTGNIPLTFLDVVNFDSMRIT